MLAAPLLDHRTEQSLAIGSLTATLPPELLPLSFNYLVLFPPQLLALTDSEDIVCKILLLLPILGMKWSQKNSVCV